MAFDWPPAPPEGYRLDDPEYEQPWYVTLLLYVWIVGVLVAVPALAIAVHGLDTTATIIEQVFQPEGFKGWMVYLGWIALTFMIFISVNRARPACGSHTSSRRGPRV